MNNAEKVLLALGEEPRSCRELAESLVMPIRSVRFALKALEKGKRIEKVKGLKQIRPTSRWRKALAPAVLALMAVLFLAGCTGQPGVKDAEAEPGLQGSTVGSLGEESDGTEAALAPAFLVVDSLQTEILKDSQACILQTEVESVIPADGNLEIAFTCTANQAMPDFNKIAVDLTWEVSGTQPADFCVHILVDYRDATPVSGSLCQPVYGQNTQHLEASWGEGTALEAGEQILFTMTVENRSTSYQVEASILVGPTHPLRIALERGA